MKEKENEDYHNAQKRSKKTEVISENVKKDNISKKVSNN